MHKYANLVELEKCCQTHLFLQNFVLIQPRTSPQKFAKFSKNAFSKNACALLVPSVGLALLDELRGAGEGRLVAPERREAAGEDVHRPVAKDLLSTFALTFVKLFANGDGSVLCGIKTDLCTLIHMYPFCNILNIYNISILSHHLEFQNLGRHPLL